MIISSFTFLYTSSLLLPFFSSLLTFLQSLLQHFFILHLFSSLSYHPHCCCCCCCFCIVAAASATVAEEEEYLMKRIQILNIIIFTRHILFCSLYRKGCDFSVKILHKVAFLFVIGFAVETIMCFSYEIRYDNLVTPMEPV